MSEQLMYDEEQRNKEYEDSCQHEWIEKGDERTANFSIRCKHCGEDGLTQGLEHPPSLFY